MDVLIACAFEIGRVFRFLAHFIKSGDDALALSGAEDFNALQRPGKRLRTADVDVQQPGIEVQGTGETFECRRRSGSKAATPKFHKLYCAHSLRKVLDSPLSRTCLAGSLWR